MTPFLLLLVLTFHPSQWHAQSVTERLGTWQQITGPAPELAPYLEYDLPTKGWEVLLTGGWCPLRDGDIVTVDGKGIIRIKNL